MSDVRQLETRQLVRQCLDGCQASMLQLVDRFSSQVFGLCYRMLGQRQDAEDMTQETFVRALKSLAGWDASRGFEPWLLSIAGNRCRTLRVARSKRPVLSDYLDEAPDRSPDQQRAENLAEEVELALADVRAEFRQAFVMFHEQGLSYLEIAAAMNCPVGTVKTWVHRARREMIARLQARGVVQGSSDAVQRICG